MSHGDQDLDQAEPLAWHAVPPLGERGASCQHTPRVGHDALGEHWRYVGARASTGSRCGCRTGL